MITDKWSSLFPNISGLGDFIKMVCFEINNMQTGGTSSVLGLFDKIKIKDIDPTPIGNILIKNLNQVLYFRNAADSDYVNLLAASLTLSANLSAVDAALSGNFTQAFTTTEATAGEQGFKITTTDSIVQTAGIIQSLLVDHNITGAKSGTAQNEAISVDMDIGANVIYAYPFASYVSQTGNPNIGFVTGHSIYLEDMGSGTLGAVAGLDIGINSTNLGSRHTGIRLVNHTGTARSGILFEKDWTIGIDLSGTASGGMAATMATADIKFHHGATLLDDGTNLTLAGVNLVIPSTADDGTYTGIVTNDSGVLKYRTKAQILADIGAAAVAHLHDTQTLEHDAVNSDGGAFSFDTTGIVTHNQIVAAPDFTILGMSGSIISSTSAETSIEELDDSQVVEINTGFLEWTSGASAATYTITGSDEFQIDRSFDGYIRGKKYSWAAGIKTGALTANACNWIYGKSDGTLDFTTTFAHATFEDNVVIFEVLYDGTNFEVVKENHVVEFQANVSLEIHDLINVLLDGTGADITRVLTGPGAAGGDREIKIVGADILHDHGLETTVPDSAGAGVTWNWYYTDGSGNWIRDALQTEAVMKWNNSGTATAIDAGKFGVWKMYVSKDDIESSAPNYFSVMSDAQYSNQNAAESAIVSGVPEATNELDELEVAQLGYIVVKNNAAGGYIINVLIEKKTLKSSTTGAGASNLASLISTNVTNFGGILSGTDTSVQIALDTLDDHLVDVNVIRDNITLNAWRIATTHALSVLKMEDGIIDVFTDETGIDTGNCINQSYDAAGDFYEPTIGYGSDVCTGGTASASSFFAGLPPASAFDDNETTKWYSDFVGETLPEWIKYDLGVGITKTAVKLRLKPYTDAGGGTLDGFTLHGSNNDADWDLLLTDNHADDGEWEDYTFANTTAYRYYRITVTSNHRVDEVAGIAEVELLESFYNNMTLISESWEAEAEPTESRLQFLMEDVDAATVNTDILGYSSLDNRANWETVTLVDEGDFTATQKIIAGSKTLTDRNDQTMVYKIVTANNKHIKIHRVGQFVK